MKRIHVLLIAIIGISLVVTGCAEQLTAGQIAQQMRAHQDSVQDFTCTMVMTNVMSNETMVMDYAYRHPDMIRMEYREPAEIAGQIMVSNGTYMWAFDPDTNTVRAAAIPEYAQTDESMNARFIGNLLDTHTIEPHGREVVSGRGCYMITATPKDAYSSQTSMELWFDTVNWMPLKIETYQDGKLFMRMEYQGIRFNTDIPNSTFEFEIPEGAIVESMDDTTPMMMTIEEAQAEVVFEIEEPDHLPQGYEIENVMVVPVSRYEDGVFITYTNATEDDIQSAQITAIQLVESAYNESVERPSPPEGVDVETIMIDGHNCTMTTMESPFGETRVLQWDDGERELRLSGMLDREEMIRIAESI